MQPSIAAILENRSMPECGPGFRRTTVAAAGADQSGSARTFGWGGRMACSSPNPQLAFFVGGLFLTF